MNEPASTETYWADEENRRRQMIEIAVVTVPLAIGVWLRGGNPYGAGAVFGAGLGSILVLLLRHRVPRAPRWRRLLGKIFECVIIIAITSRIPNTCPAPRSQQPVAAHNPAGK